MGTSRDLPLTDDSAAGYDTWGHAHTPGGNLEMNFDAENRLATVKKGTETTAFAYDADGQRVMTTYPDGTKVYTPFPDYEVTDPPTAAYGRTTYRLASRIGRADEQARRGTFYYTLHRPPGNLMALSTTGGTCLRNRPPRARYDPSARLQLSPQPAIQLSRPNGFTGHRHNNTGDNDLGLIYMNARQLPAAGGAVYWDTMVPGAGEPAEL